jgi:hypothetical protein
MRPRPLLAVALLTVVGAALRIAVARQGLLADELSSYWIVQRDGLGDVIDTVATDAEITPPLFFVASWLATQLGDAAELVRLPSLLAGVATIPLVFAVGRRTVGTSAALVACALATFSPFLVYYSAEARGYALMVVFVLLAALAVLLAVERGGRRWWVLFAVASCAAVYSHYTSVFALAGLLGWTLWAHPAARRPALLATAAAGIAFLPWVPGLRGDMASPTTDILSALQPFSFPYLRAATVHWAIGFPYAFPSTEVEELPGWPALAALALALALAAAGIVAGALRGTQPLRRPGPGVVLAVLLACSVPVGELAASALGPGLYGTRNLAAAWPGFALCLAAVLLRAGPRLGAVAAGLAVAAFASGGLKLLDPDFARPDSAAIARAIEARGTPADVVIDGASLVPAGVPTALDAELGDRRRILPLGRTPVAYDPFRILGPAPTVESVVQEAAAAARGAQIIVVLGNDSPVQGTVEAALPPGYRRIGAVKRFGGFLPAMLLVYEDQTATGA